ncbi:hypothetical protein KW797_01930 [Candidatus Parcubacteria bacterium]|nr:hypothetical protein [Candidatus Parcubacteria bacterium]
MAIPNKATGYGNNSTAVNVFRVTFSTALSTAPKYEAYDGGTFPAVGSATTTANRPLAGTAGNSNKSMICLVDSTGGAPTSNWKPASATGGSANPNRLKGQTSYVTAGGTPGAGGVITFNMVVEVPSDAAPTDNWAFDLLIRYTYTGAAPTLTWAFNEGSEGTPTWTTLTPGTHGLRHTRAGISGGGPYLSNIPTSGTEDTAEGWVTT